jgi:hypothetical protein
MKRARRRRASVPFAVMWPGAQRCRGLARDLSGSAANRSESPLRALPSRSRAWQPRG